MQVTETLSEGLKRNYTVVVASADIEGKRTAKLSEIGRTLKRIRDEKGLSIVVSEQVLSFALDIADRVLVIENGNIVREDLRSKIDEKKVAAYLSV